MCVSFAAIGDANIVALDFVRGGTSFFVCGIGGVLVGVVFALLVSFITR
jgi:hypothetical protein